MKGRTVKVFAPATVANLGCGFDVMGLAIDQPGDEIIVKANNEKKLVIKKITGDQGKLSYDPQRNTCTVAIQSLLDELKLRQGFDVVIRKHLAIGSGLGSSASSAVAGTVAANVLLGKPFKKNELLPFAMKGEEIASGAWHADNVAPCLFGGIVLIRSYHPLDVIQLPVPKNLFVVIVHPHVEVLTKDARAILGKNVPLKNAVQQWGNTAAFIAGIYKNDLELVGRAVEDLVAEPHRARLIPQYSNVKEAALNAGALACNISGSGPSLFAFCSRNQNEIGKAMKKQFQAAGIRSDVFISKINRSGACEIK